MPYLAEFKACQTFDEGQRGNWAAKRVEHFVEKCVESAKNSAQREGRKLTEEQESRMRKSWDKNWEEWIAKGYPRSDAIVTTLRKSPKK